MNDKLRLLHLYPDHMNLYGDRGNILALQQRAAWRGITLTVDRVNPGETYDVSEADLLFMGGGQDRGQKIVGPDLMSRAEHIRAAADRFLVCLLVCGGYQLFGQFFKTSAGEEIPGIGVLDIRTIASPKRMIGNVVVDVRDETRGWELPVSTLVGFENHSGRTYLGDGVRPLGKVIVGNGNNGEDKTEGAVYKNVYGTYLHGSLLPKNPEFTDHLLLLALKRRYGREITLAPLESSLEHEAHQAAIDRAFQTQSRPLT